MGDIMAETKDEKNKVEVEIYGQRYTLKGPFGEEKIKKLAKELDGLMNEVAAAAPHLATHQIAVLVSLRLLNDYNELKQEYDKGFQLALFKDSDSDIF
jgi:cell division protein ZapA